MSIRFVYIHSTNVAFPIKTRGCNSLLFYCLFLCGGGFTECLVKNWVLLFNMKVKLWPLIDPLQSQLNQPKLQITINHIFYSSYAVFYETVGSRIKCTYCFIRIRYALDKYQITFWDYWVLKLHISFSFSSHFIFIKRVINYQQKLQK